MISTMANIVTGYMLTAHDLVSAEAMQAVSALYQQKSAGKCLVKARA